MKYSAKYREFFPMISINVSLEHKTSHKGQFGEIEIYTS